jgi:hypothetical protein
VREKANRYAQLSSASILASAAFAAYTLHEISRLGKY